MMLRIRKPATLFAAAILGLSMAACGKKADASVPASPSQAQAPSAPESSPAGSSDSTAVESPAAPPPAVSDPAQINRALRRWILANRRPPTNFGDFAATSGIQIAPPPEGKKYAIDKTMHVILVKR